MAASLSAWYAPWPARLRIRQRRSRNSYESGASREQRSKTMSTTAEQVKALEAEHVLQTYKRLPVVFVRGEGTHLYDESGREYLDFISGIGVVVLGHAHPGLAAVIADQAKTLIHTSNLYYHPLQG